MAGAESRESVIPYDLSVKSVSNVVAVGEGWHILCVGWCLWKDRQKIVGWSTNLTLERPYQ